jgi:hypothetical protein
VFDSDLFHETDRIAFKEGYLNRRINITMLYGRRGKLKGRGGAVADSKPAAAEPTGWHNVHRAGAGAAGRVQRPKRRYAQPHKALAPAAAIC